MTSRFRIHACWPARTDPTSRSEQQLLALLQTLGWLDPGLGPLSFEDAASGEILAVDSAARCAEALAQAEIEWQAGGDVQTCHALSLFLGPAHAPAAELTLTCGIRPIGIGPLFAPNRIELLLREGAGDDRATRPFFEDALRSIAALFRPSFGFVGRGQAPAPPEALFDEGAPAVGWMTYLSSEYGEIPSLPRPAAARPVAHLGTLVVAHPGPFDDRDPEHLAAIAAVRSALGAAGVLVPGPALSRAAT